MSRLKSLLNPKTYLRPVRELYRAWLFRRKPSMRGAVTYPPGHFYSPLLDIGALAPGAAGLPFDGAEYWEHIDLRPAEQRAYYADLLQNFPIPPFPAGRTEGRRYFTGNGWFDLADAFTLSGILRKERPARIVEVGSGFSSAVMLDTLESSGATAQMTFIEPGPDRLKSLLSAGDKARSSIMELRVQEVPMEVFDQLGEHDILFIDSSHVAKAGSDVTHILLRILPRLKPGVIVHFHDIFYPHSYPAHWIRQGRAWNETIFLRAFLLGGAPFRILAFNSYAAQAFPELFREKLPGFLDDPGGSLWLRKES